MSRFETEIAAIEAALSDTRKGLPEEILRFVSRLTPLVNVDLLIKDERQRTLLTWRDDDLFGQGWHLPGSLVRYKELAADRIRACAREELGADVETEPQPIFVFEGISSALSRAHHVSLLYRCRLVGRPDDARRAVSDPPGRGHWQWHDRCPLNLIHEHVAYARFI